MTGKDNQKDKRSRNWSFIVYPESTLCDWVEVLCDTGEKWIRSPLHDKDINETTNELKKPHWHVIMTFANKKSFAQVKKITDLLNSPIPQTVANLKGAVQYLWHRNNPEKYQYDKKEVEAFNGFKYRQYLNDIGVDTDEILKEIVNWISEKNCVEYADLVNYSVQERFDDWFPIVRSKTIFLNAYIRSNRFRLGKKIDGETGEIIIDDRNED